MNFLKKIFKRLKYDNTFQFLTVLFLLFLGISLYVGTKTYKEYNINKEINQKILKESVIKQDIPLPTKKEIENNIKLIKFDVYDGKPYVEMTLIKNNNKKIKTKITISQYNDFTKFLVNNNLINKYTIIRHKSPELKPTKLDEIIMQNVNYVFSAVFAFFEFLFPFFFIFFVILIYKQLKMSGMIKDSDKIKILKPNQIEVDLKNIIGNDKVKEELYNYLKNTSENLILTGPAGTGKTLIVQALAKELNLPLIYTSASLMVSPFQGSGAMFVKTLFKTAEKTANANDNKVILFIDEAEELLKDRSEFQNSSNPEERTGPINVLLSELDGIKRKERNIIVVLATNFNGTNFNIDKAVDRRFRKKVLFTLPDKKDRLKLIQYYKNKYLQ